MLKLLDVVVVDPVLAPIAGRGDVKPLEASGSRRADNKKESFIVKVGGVFNMEVVVLPKAVHLRETTPSR
jgi:hypothetical protein